jgi:hypothetical protein
MNKSLAALAISLILGITACTPPYRQTFNDEGKAKGWTQKQTDAAFAYADRTFWSREVKENTYVISYGKVPTAKVEQQLVGVLKDLNDGLDPKNTEMRQYIETFKLRKDLEHDEEIAQAIYERVRVSELDGQFKQMTGDAPEYGVEAELAQGYNIRKIYVNKPLAEAFPFTSEQIEAAKKSGTLKVISSATLDYSNEYDHKEADPKAPEDPNAFVWKSRHQKIVLTEYKIVDVEKPLDNKGDYIEGYRVIEGKQESRPAIKVFFPTSGSMAILLVDTDEEGQPGFGVPDIIQQISDETNVSELLNSGDLLNSLFDKKEAKKNREVQEAQLFKIEIMPIGGHIDEWQKSPDSAGWIVPFKYVNDKGDNYNVRIHYKKPSFDPNTASTHPHSEYMEIEYIEKEFTKSGERYEASNGKVIEYFRPRKDFSGPVKAKVQDEDNTKKVSFEFEDGSVVDGFVTPGKNKFIEDAPYAKSYNEGQKRWWIEKSGDSGIYDKRKSVGQPKEQTGEYSDEEYEFHVESGRAAGKFGDDENRKPICILGTKCAPVVKIERETQQAPPTAKQ